MSVLTSIAIRPVRPLLLVLALSLVAFAVFAQEGEKPAPRLAVEAIAVSPEKPAADALCQLRVKVKNSGERTVSALRFTVELGGQSLRVYDRQLFMDALEPGAVTELRLYNFWTSESGRPAPANGKLEIEVALAEASYVTIEKGEDGEEIWTLGDPVPGLPVSKSAVVELAGLLMVPPTAEP